MAGYTPFKNGRTVELTDSLYYFSRKSNQPDQQLKIFHFQYGDERADTLLTAPLDDKQWIGAAINAHRWQTYRRLFSPLSCLSSSHLLAEATLQESIQTSTVTMLAYTAPQQLQLFVSEAGQLVFANTFRPDSLLESLYFCLYVLYQLKIDPLALRLVVCADASEKIPLAEAMGRYVSHIYPASFTVIPHHPLEFSAH
jgi:hypothetical protein